ncbi:hypothetical protein CTA2_12653 [Colletotrichum tanaceti]|uniref:Uncharacterized protein n=1 Tax=Colletotrichum tanaceti TaxID=1306861 RepID=A0A4U6XPJ1_9PEZI|nr:hypothetical protein CTA2_12653 [Colletotrichum tanaceti]TKW57720.1 hypothetical protein CTA1_11525 [Colletotrichum tanaceti]
MANANHRFASWSVQSLFLWLLLPALLINGSATSLKLPRQNEYSWPTFDPGYRGCVAKGQYFNQLFLMNDFQATNFNGHAPVASQFQHPNALKRYGWSRYIYWASSLKNTGDSKPLFRKLTRPALWGLNLDISKVPGYGNDLDRAFNDTEHPVNRLEEGVYHYRHDRMFGQFKTKTPTWSSYSNVLVPTSGAIIFDDNVSPEERNKQWKIGKIPKLNALSDIAFLQWMDACQAKDVDPASLKLVFVSQVVHEATYRIVASAIRTTQHNWLHGYEKKRVFSMDTRQGQAILGTSTGSAIAWLLIQHKKELGLKKITEVAVWGSRSGFKMPSATQQVRGQMNLRFVIEDA